MLAFTLVTEESATWFSGDNETSVPQKANKSILPDEVEPLQLLQDNFVFLVCTLHSLKVVAPHFRLGTLIHITSLRGLPVASAP